MLGTVKGGLGAHSFQARIPPVYILGRFSVPQSTWLLASRSGQEHAGVGLQEEDGQPALGSVPVQPQLEIDEECLLAQAGGSPSPTLPSPSPVTDHSPSHLLATFSWSAPGSPVKYEVQL